MAAKKPIISIGDVLKEKYEVLKPLGQGGFGAIFQVKDKKTEEIYALKVELELPKADEPGIDLEIGVLKRLQNSIHALKFIDSGKIDKLSFVIMQLVGCNLSDLRKACPQMKYTESTAIRISLQCMEAIVSMHVAGLLHRDVKPANFAMGRTVKDYRNVYILDFGLVRRYRLKNGQVRPARKCCGFRGTVKYASMNCHDGIDQGRGDDIWSWLYMLIEFLKSELPWRTETDRKKIRQMKGTSKKDLLQGLEPEFERIYSSLESIKYTDEPPYHWYRQKLNEIMHRKQYTLNDPFDWEEKGTYHEQLKKVCPQPYEKQMQAKEKVVMEKDECSKDEEDSKE